MQKKKGRRRTGAQVNAAGGELPPGLEGPLTPNFAGAFSGLSCQVVRGGEKSLAGT